MNSVTVKPYYRCYLLDSEKHIIGVEVLHQCANDAEARQVATSMLEKRHQYSGVLVCDRARTVFEKLISCVFVMIGSSVADTLDRMAMFKEFAATLMV
jgi:hypothetical protein